MGFHAKEPRNKGAERRKFFASLFLRFFALKSMALPNGF
jgi:hypothetical protein